MIAVESLPTLAFEPKEVQKKYSFPWIPEKFHPAQVLTAVLNRFKKPTLADGVTRLEMDIQRDRAFLADVYETITLERTPELRQFQRLPNGNFIHQDEMKTGRELVHEQIAQTHTEITQLPGLADIVRGTETQTRRDQTLARWLRGCADYLSTKSDIRLSSHIESILSIEQQIKNFKRDGFNRDQQIHDLRAKRNALIRMGAQTMMELPQYLLNPSLFRVKQYEKDRETLVKFHMDPKWRTYAQNPESIDAQVSDFHKKTKRLNRAIGRARKTGNNDEVTRLQIAKTELKASVESLPSQIFKKDPYGKVAAFKQKLTASTMTEAQTREFHLMQAYRKKSSRGRERFSKGLGLRLGVTGLTAGALILSAIGGKLPNTNSPELAQRVEFSPTPDDSEKNDTPVPTPTQRPILRTPLDLEPKSQPNSLAGFATWYNLPGITSSGEIFNPNAQAFAIQRSAHVPFHTRFIVSDGDTHKSAIAVNNDYIDGPQVANLTPMLVKILGEDPKKGKFYDITLTPITSDK